MSSSVPPPRPLTHSTACAKVNYRMCKYMQFYLSDLQSALFYGQLLSVVCQVFRCMCHHLLESVLSGIACTIICLIHPQINWFYHVTAIDDWIYSESNGPLKLELPGICLFADCPVNCLSCSTSADCAHCDDITYLKMGTCVSDCGQGFYQDPHSRQCTGKIHD